MRPHLKFFLLIVALLSLANSSFATNHITRVDEVMIGAFGRTDIQFIEVSHSGCSQTSWSVGTPPRTKLVFFDDNNNQVGEFLVPNNPTCNSGTALFATQAFADLASTPTPDFIMPVLGVPESGKVCFRDNPAASGEFDVDLCLSYGSFTGDSEQGSASNAAQLPHTDICSLKRTGNAFFDEPNFNDDFTVEVPTPKNTAGATGTVDILPQFNDVPAGNPFFRFIEALANASVTGGCGGGNFCPNNNVTRAQMAVFLLVANEGPGLVLPACAGLFADVPCSNPFARFIEELSIRGITGGCGGGNFCPNAPVTRAQMAVFLAVTFGLPIPVLPANTACAPPPPVVDHGDTPGTATMLTVGGPAVAGDIQVGGDVDFFSFDLGSGQSVVIETSNLGAGSDTFMDLFDVDGTTFLDSDDDGGAGLASRIAFVAPAAGKYFVRIRHFSAAGTGTYSISVQ